MKFSVKWMKSRGNNGRNFGGKMDETFGSYNGMKTACTIKIKTLYIS